MKVTISEIKIDPTVGIRQRLDEETIERYMEILDELPPVVVYQTDGELLLADGFHREAAAQRLNRSEIEAEVRKGSREDALEYAVVANTRFPKALTREEYKEAVRRIQRLHSDWGSRAIARLIGRGEGFVRNIIEADEVRRGVVRTTPLSDSHLSEVHQADRSLWSDLVKAGEERKWSRDELRDVIREVKDEAIPLERKEALLAGKAEPLTEKGGEPAVRRETLERIAAEAKAESVGMMLYGALHHLANLRRFTPKEVVDRMEEHELQRLVVELPEYIEFQQSMLAIAKQRLEIWQGG